MPKWLPLMRTGKFTDRHNKTYDITKETLNGIVEGFDGTNSPAHLVVGHPNADTVPSFGLVDKLKVIGDKLFFQARNIVPEFQALVAKGGFPAISAGLTTGMKGLHHIAFLSGQKPAISGLEPIAEFSGPEHDTDVVSIDVSEFVLTNKAEFSESWIGWRFRDIANALRKLREYLIVKDGVEATDQVLSSWLIDSIGEVPPQPTENTPQFSGQEGDDMQFELLYNQEKAAREKLEGQLAEFQAAEKTSVETITALQGEIGTLKTAIADMENKAVEAEFCAYVEGLITSKKLLPDAKTDTVAALVSLHKAQQAPEFSAPEDATKTPLAMFKTQLEKGQFVPGRDHTVTVPPKPEFSAADGSVDPKKLGKAAENYIDEQAKKGHVVSAQEAVAHLMGN